MKNLEKLTKLLKGLDDQFHAQVDAAARTEPALSSVRRRSPASDPFHMEWAWAVPGSAERQAAPRADAKAKWASGWQRSWKTIYGIAVTAAAVLFLVLWLHPSPSGHAVSGPEELIAYAEAEMGQAKRQVFHVTCPRAGFVTIVPYQVGVTGEFVSVQPRRNEKFKRVKAEQPWKYAMPTGERAPDSLVFVVTETPADSFVQRLIEEKLRAGMPNPDDLQILIRDELWKAGYTWAAFAVAKI